MTLWKTLFPWMQREPSAGEDTPKDARQPEAAKPDKPAGQLDHAKVISAAGSAAALGLTTAAAAGTLPPSSILPDLNRLSSLTAPHRPDPFGHTAPPLTREAAALSLALAEMTYTLDITPWMAAGWRDFSFQVDNVLESGQLPDSSIQTLEDHAFQQLAALHRMRRAQAALKARNPFGQLLAALRQREGSDTVKAVCMAHPLPDGRELIAIGFMGTGKRFYDWFSNFRFADEAGFHQGFSQLCSHFEAAAEQIVFPGAAMRLGLERLTLRDILTELGSPDSRFRLWMAGHSQGGAVMQVFTHHLLQNGALAKHICGYGFASPTAASAPLTDRPWEAPLWHLQNRDDLVPRIGAQMHLGRCVEYAPSQPFRQQAYRYSTLPADAACRAWMEPLLRRIRDTGDNLLHVTALMLCAAEEKGEDALNLLMDRGRNLALLDWLYAFAGDRAQNAVGQLEAHQRRMYRELTGHDMDSRRLNALKEEMRPWVAATPLRRILTNLAACLTQPHLTNEGGTAAPGAYELLVQQPMGRMRPFRWEIRAGQPVMRYSTRPVQTAERRNAGTANHTNRRAALAQGKARLGRHR